MAVFRNKQRKGKWAAQITYYDDAGKRRYISELHSTKAKAQAAERRLKAKYESLRDGISKTDIELTLGALSSRLGPRLWEGLKETRDAPRRLQTAVELIGEKTPLPLNTQDLDKLVKKLRARGLTGATINRYLNAVNKLLKAGYDRELVEALPKATPWQKESTPRSRWITDEERPRLLQALRDYPHCPRFGAAMAAFAIVSFKTGARRGELLAVDPNRDLVAPRGDALGTVTFRDTKNSTARTVMIDKEVFDLLKKWAPWGKEQTGYGTFHHQMYKAWDIAKKAMGLEDDEQFTPHAMRHSHATYMVETGVNLRVIQEQLGHKQVQTTQRYAHVSSAARETATKSVLKRIG